MEQQFLPESDEGSNEYKFKLTDLTIEHRDRLVAQMKYRLQNGDGEATYDIGITDAGFPLGITGEQMNESLANLTEIATLAGANIASIRKNAVTHTSTSEHELISKYLNKGKNSGSGNGNGSGSGNGSTLPDEPHEILHEFIRYVSEVTVQRNIGNVVEMRIGVMGNVDCGKSTLVGVLSTGKLDNGSGSARSHVFNYRHELETGRTSSISQQIIGFKSSGKLVNENMFLHGKCADAWEQIQRSSDKIITLFDLAGHDKYLKTTIIGIASNRPDYVMVVVGANIGITGLGTIPEHLKICENLSIPYIIVFTKIDNAPRSIYNETYDAIVKIITLKSGKKPFLIKNENDIQTCTKNISTGSIVPIINVSNVSGEGMSNLKQLLYLLPPKKINKELFRGPTKFQVQDIWNVKGVGKVIGGMLFSGTAVVGGSYLLGPTNNGQFEEVQIKSIHCKKIPTSRANAVTYVTVCINTKKTTIVPRKGMFLIDLAIVPKLIWEFIAEIYVTSIKSTNIRVDYQPICHVGHITQTCCITEVIEITKKRNKEFVGIGVGDLALVKIRFCYRPELIFESAHQKILLREGSTRAVGEIRKLLDTKYEPINTSKRR